MPKNTTSSNINRRELLGSCAASARRGHASDAARERKWPKSDAHRRYTPLRRKTDAFEQLKGGSR
jgi:hypothetical protein